MNTERISPKIIFVNWRQIDSQAVKIRHTRTVYEQSRREQAPQLYFTKCWQIENKHFVIPVLDVFESWKNWREITNFDSRNFREEEWSKIISKMANLYAVDNYITFPVNLRYFLFLDRNAQFKGFLCNGKYSGASKYWETRNRKWWSRPQPILSQNGKNPKQPEETIDWNSNALPEGVYLKN